MDYRKHPDRRYAHFFSSPIIWSVLIPIVLMDIWSECYHRICFKIYGLPYIKRSTYIKIDRHKLQYLKWYEKLGCAYCGYANGLFAYWVQIGAATEQYWCGIMHQKKKGFLPPAHHKNFTPYNDKDAFEHTYRPETKK